MSAPIGDECYTELQEYEQFNIVQLSGFVDGRRACVRGGRAGHLPNRPDGVVRRGSSSGALGQIAECH